MAFKRSAVRSRLSPPTTDRKANSLRSCFIYGSDTPLPLPTTIKLSTHCVHFQYEDGRFLFYQQCRKTSEAGICVCENGRQRKNCSMQRKRSSVKRDWQTSPLPRSRKSAALQTAHSIRTSSARRTSSLL